MSLPKPTSGGKTDSKPGTAAKVPVTDNVGDEKPANIVVVDREETGGEGVDNEFYDVEAIKGIRVFQDARREYLVRWVGFDKSQDSWEEDLNCPDCLYRFYQQLIKRANEHYRAEDFSEEDDDE